jgi:hypothetical protein
MSQQQNWLAGMPASKVHLQVMAKFGGFVEFSVAAEGFKLRRQERAQAIHGRLIVAGRFNLHQLPEGGDDFVLPLFEIPQAACGLRGGSLHGLLLPASFHG